MEEDCETLRETCADTQHEFRALSKEFKSLASEVRGDISDMRSDVTKNVRGMTAGMDEMRLNSGNETQTLLNGMNEMRNAFIGLKACVASITSPFEGGVADLNQCREDLRTKFSQVTQSIQQGWQ
jgi:hypothetical protein